MDINDLKKIGLVIQLDGQPYEVIESQHARTAQRRAFVRTKLKNLITGLVKEKTFNAGDKIEEANLEKIKANFLYADQEDVFFMENKNFEQFSLSRKQISPKDKFLKDGQEVTILIFNGKPISIELPAKVELKVIEAPPGIKGDSATNIMKKVKLETGLEIDAPLFIKAGDIIRVNTETGEYVERV
jgi:elongation factor P